MKTKFSLFAFIVGIMALGLVAQASHDNHPQRGDCDRGRELAQERRGITHADFPDGLCFPSFNNYTDNNIVRNWPRFEDERRYVLAKLDGEEDAEYRDEVRVRVGDIVTFIAYVHNNADKNHNDDDRGSRGRSVARDTETRVDTFFHDPSLGDNAYATVAQERLTITQFIEASNTTPRAISDATTIISANGEPVRLRYIERGSNDLDGNGRGDPTAKFRYTDPFAGGQARYQFFSASAFFGNGAAFGSPATNGDDYFASEEYMGFLFFKAQVIERQQPPPPPVQCESIRIVQPASHEFDPHGNDPINMRIRVEPGNYEGPIEWTSVRGDHEVVAGSNNRRAVLREYGPPTVVRVFTPDGRCFDQIRAIPPPPPPPPPPPIECVSIQISLIEFNAHSPEPLPIQITNIEAQQNGRDAEYDGNFQWEVENGGRLTVSDDTRSAILFERTQNSVVTIASDDARCNAQVRGVEAPPPPPPPPGPPPPPPPPQQQLLFCTSLAPDRNSILRGVPSQSFNVFVNPGDFRGSIVWIHSKNGIEVERRGGSFAIFNDLDNLSRILVYAEPESLPGICRREIGPEPIQGPGPSPGPGPGPPPNVRPVGNIQKTASSLRSGGNVIHEDDLVEYQLIFRAQTFVGEVNIKDTMRPITVGTQQGKLHLVPWEDAPWRGSNFKVERIRNNARSIVPRHDNRPEGAGQSYYRGSPFSNDGISLYALQAREEVVITYRAELRESRIKALYCRTQVPRNFCGEEFDNTVEARIIGGDVLRPIKRKLFTPCPLLLTQGIGDVILERDLDVGNDALGCGSIPNIEGPIIIPDVPPEEREISKEGKGDEILMPLLKLCEESSKDKSLLPEDFPAAYKNPVDSLSSNLCELTLNVAENILKKQALPALQENIARFTHSLANLGERTNVRVANLNAPPLIGPRQNQNPNFAIYKLKRGNLTVERINAPVGPGARTYVIEDGDLFINGDITFSTQSFDIGAPEQVPSIAFIVTNGTIHIAPEVKHLSGVFVTIAGGPGTGQIVGGVSNFCLTIDGVVVGDIEPLFASRDCDVNPLRGEGTVTIQYGAWLFYNMPPILKEITELQQEAVAR